jgi:hypothetical protein
MDRETALAKLAKLRPQGRVGGLRTQGAVATAGKAVSPQPTFGLGLAAGARDGDFRIAIRVQDERLLDSVRVRAIADEVGGEVDVQFVGTPRPFSATPAPTRRARPIVPGCSIAPVTTDGAGTLGCFVADAEGRYVLSNSHVLTNHGTAPLGTEIIQPGVVDGGSPASDVVGRLKRAVDMDTQALNLADCAIADLGEVVAEPTIPGLGRPSATPSAPDVGLNVTKRGRSTDITVGTVTALAVNLKFDWPQGLMELADLVEISTGPGEAPFAAPGDSGSLILISGDLHPLALLVGGGPGHDGRMLVYATPITTVLQELGVTLV